MSKNFGVIVFILVLFGALYKGCSTVLNNQSNSKTQGMKFGDKKFSEDEAAEYVELLETGITEDEPKANNEKNPDELVADMQYKKLSEKTGMPDAINGVQLEKAKTLKLLRLTAEIVSEMEANSANPDDIRKEMSQMDNSETMDYISNYLYGNSDTGSNRSKVSMKLRELSSSMKAGYVNTPAGFGGTMTPEENYEQREKERKLKSMGVDVE